MLGTVSVLEAVETQIEQHEKNEITCSGIPLATIDPYTVHGPLRPICATVL